jgi:YebC/PmpR family DNA-binding regulatory protein
MAGHSKWKTTKHYKAATDKKRGALFTKLIREITVAAKTGGGDPDGNPRLRTAIDNARALSMPKENIERAVAKGTGDLEGVDYVEVMYEAYGPGGVALMIAALTDNATRTVAEVRAKLARNGGNLGTSNSVAFMFDRKGQIMVPVNGMDEDAAMEKALEAGAEDIEKVDDTFVITTAPADLHSVSQALAKVGLVSEKADFAWISKSTIQVSGETASSLLKLIDVIEELEDVQKVDANFEMDESEMAEA